jgi:hypothetical protein
VGGDQMIERVSMHVWKFTRSKDKQFVKRQVFDLQISAAGWDPLFRGLRKHALSRVMFHHHFTHAHMA